jgi:hypothetical protein
MHGELPKQHRLAKLAGTGSSRRRYIIYGAVLLAVAGARDYVFGTPAASPPTARCRCWS